MVIQTSAGGGTNWTTYNIKGNIFMADIYFSVILIYKPILS